MVEKYNIRAKLNVYVRSLGNDIWRKFIYDSVATTRLNHLRHVLSNQSANDIYLQNAFGYNIVVLWGCEEGKLKSMYASVKAFLKKNFLL